MSTLIFGLGNPILSDDAVGLVVARAVHALVAHLGVEFVEASVAGLGVLDLIAGHDRVIVVDAIQTSGGSVGDLYELSPGDILSTPRLASPHDVDLGLALELGRHFELAMPEEVVIYAVEVADPYTFGEELTPRLAERVPEIVQTIVDREFGRRSELPDNKRRSG
ncbi:MAG: hydrogenase maturation protease [Dehalococcoidales bacterium]|nr:hydrogenase maturation protease [Dehalococcoidales bacterium]